MPTELFLKPSVSLTHIEPVGPEKDNIESSYQSIKQNLIHTHKHTLLKRTHVLNAIKHSKGVTLWLAIDDHHN